MTRGARYILLALVVGVVFGATVTILAETMLLERWLDRQYPQSLIWYIVLSLYAPSAVFSKWTGLNQLIDPIIIGFSSVFYGVVFMAPALGMALGRARLRRHRQQQGLCSECGYDLTGNESGVCPECGSEIEKP